MDYCPGDEIVVDWERGYLDHSVAGRFAAGGGSYLAAIVPVLVLVLAL